MLKMESVVSSLVAKVAEIANRSSVQKDIDTRADLMDTGYLDSLGLAILSLYVEEQYGIRMSGGELEELASIDAIAQTILSKSSLTEP